MKHSVSSTSGNKIAPASNSRIGSGGRRIDRRARRSIGASSVELVCGLLMLVPITLVLLDLGSIMIFVFANDSLCRETCRAASAADPKDAKEIAEQFIRRANSNGTNIAVYKLIENPQISELKVPPLEEGGLVEGNVTVKTGVDVKPMFLISAIYGGKPVLFATRQTFPITFVVQPKQLKSKNGIKASQDDEEQE